MNIDEASPRTNTQMLAWVRGWHSRLRRQAYTIEITSAEIRGRLARARGLEKMQARIKARKVARRFNRASRLLEAAAAEMSKGLATYTREYQDQFPAAQRKAPRGRGADRWRFNA
jgi:hypothetical protein